MFLREFKPLIWNRATSFDNCCALLFSHWYGINKKRRWFYANDRNDRLEIWFFHPPPLGGSLFDALYLWQIFRHSSKQYALLHIFHCRGDDVQLCGVFSDHQKQRKTVVILEHKGLPILRKYVRQLKGKLDFFAAKHIWQKGPQDEKAHTHNRYRKESFCVPGYQQP